MPNTGKRKGAARTPQDPREGRAKTGKPSTSRSRRESMDEPRRKDLQDPRSSGTTGLGGESSSGGSLREPGGVEGASGE